MQAKAKSGGLAKFARAMVVLVAGILMSATITFHQTTYDDFSGGVPSNVDVITPDPDGLDDGALQLTEFDTIYVLQVYPDGHCTECITDVVYTYEDAGIPALTFKFFITTLSEYNTIHSPDDVIRMADSHTWDLVEMPVDFFHIIFFGIANGFGGRSNDLNNHSKRATIEFAQRGKGLVLTHDTIAKRRGWTWDTPLCTDTRNFEHENFNTLTEVTGLTADWVSCYEPDEIFNDVELADGVDPSSIVLNVPFALPPTFEVTDCHDFGETYSAGDLWYTSAEGEIYMHTYNDPDYNSFSAFFSTGHAEDYEGDHFRPSEWETKAMINSMYYAYNGGEGVGMYLSDIWTLPGEGELDSITWSETVPDYAALRIQAKVSEDGATWTDWYDIVSGDPITGVDFRHLQYRVLMDRGVGRPILHSITVYATVPAPEVNVIAPLEYSSCSTPRILFSVESEGEIIEDSYAAYIEGMTTSPSDFSWVGADSLLLEMVSPTFTSGDTVTGMFADIRNDLGFSIVDSVGFSYIVDLDTPYLSYVRPLPDTLFASPWFNIEIFIEDDLAGVIYDSITVTLNGEILEDGIWDAPSGRMFFDDSDIYAADSCEICVRAADQAEMCGANVLDTCWSFYVDTIGPVIELVEPMGYTSCDSLHSIFSITDQSGVDISSIEVSCDGVYSWPTHMEWDGTELTFDPGVWFGMDGEIIVLFNEVSDSAGNTTRNVRFTISQDIHPPEVSARHPEPDDVMGDSINHIYFELTDEGAGVDRDSVRVYIDGTEVMWVPDGDGFRVEEDVVPHYVDGETCYVCISFDDLAMQCGSNSDSICWSWTVNLAGPVARMATPVASHTTSCNEGPILIALEDPNGVNETTISIDVDGTHYRWDSPAVSFENDTITYTPGLSWDHGDTITVMVRDIEDMIGNLMADPLDVWFIVDLEGPVIEPVYPVEGEYVPPDPIVSIYLYDELSGIDTDSVWVVFEGYDFQIDDPAFNISADTLFFDLSASSVEYGDTVCLTVVAMDSVASCERNRAEHSWCFYVDKGGPRAQFVEPPGGIHTSCADQEIRLVLTDRNGVEWETVSLLIEEDTLDISDERLVLTGDTLIYIPTPLWASGDTIDITLISAQDGLGNELLSAISHSFMVDLAPPVFDGMYPTTGAIISDPFDIPWFVVRDSLSGIDPTQVRIRAMGDEWGYSEIRTNGDTIFFDSDFLGTHFPERETTWVTVIASDMAMFCGSNTAACTTFFYLPDHDTLPPVFAGYNPPLWMADSVFDISVTVKDTSGIFAPSDSTDSQSARLIWDIDDELETSYYTRHMIAENETTLVTSIPGMPSGTVITARVEAYDNDFDFEIREDRTGFVSDIFQINIVPRPLVELIYPESGSFISCPDQPLYFLISSETTLSMESLELTIQGEGISWPDSRLSVSGDTLIYIPSDMAEEGHMPLSLGSLTDVNGYPALSSSWDLYVDITPPEIDFDYPEDGGMVPSEEPYVRFGVSDLLSGTNYENLYATVILGAFDTIGTYSASECIVDNTIDFDACGIPYADGDSFTVVIEAEDNPDLCSPNTSTAQIMFWLEPALDCNISTNPFTPNQDTYNDEVMFFFPALYSKGGTVTIYDLRSNKVKDIEVPAGEQKDSIWDGKSDSGENMPSGIYIYIVESDSKRVCKGTVTLAR